MSFGLLAAVVGAALISSGKAVQADDDTATPIKHLVVIFQENVSFDHYFATYPQAANTAGEPSFHRQPGTPSVNGLGAPCFDQQPQLRPAVPLGPDPRRHTCDQDHSYKDEQQAFDDGLMDRVRRDRRPRCRRLRRLRPRQGPGHGLLRRQHVTALWNYAQHFAMSDNSFSTPSGPPRRGAINLVSRPDPRRSISDDSTAVLEPTDPDYPDRRPPRDDDRRPAADLRRLQQLGRSWPSRAATRTSATCSTPRASPGAGSRAASADRHRRRPRGLRRQHTEHRRRQRSPTTSRTTSRSSTTQSTANPHHLPPTSVAEIGHDGPGQPPVRPDRLLTARRRAATCRRSASSRRPRTRTATPATPTRWTSSASWSTRSTSCRSRRMGARPRSSSPTTTPTAGTTTSCARSSTAPPTAS